jgi:amidase
MTAPDRELLFRPVHELAALIRSGELRACELVEASLRSIEELEPSINAFVDIYADDALAEATAITSSDPRPFAGVPIAIKDNRGIAGHRMTFGTTAFAEQIAPTDHNVVRRLKRAGFVVVGSTTTPALGILPTTESAAYGATHNPWNLKRTSGGSSGGSAAAVAAGMVPIAHSNDGGGSTRIPASCCGLVGLKPQRARISLAPDAGYSFLVQDGVLTRTVGETAALLDLLAGPELGDVAWAPPPEEAFARQAARDPGRLRIAMIVSSPVHGVRVDRGIEAAVRDAALLLESLGHDVVELVEAPWDRYDFVPLFRDVFSAPLAARVELAQELAGRPLDESDFEALSWALYRHCKTLDSVQLIQAEAQLHRIGRALVEWVAQFDAVLMPALAEAPVPLGTIDPFDRRDPMRAFSRSLEFMPFTPLFNISGQPAISLPLFQDDAGLPLAVQLVGQPAGEGALLSLAAQLEAARPWSQRRPSVSNTH